MKRQNSILSAITSLSICVATPILGQQPPAAPAAVPAGRAQKTASIADQDEKEKTEDDALLRQIDGASQSGDTRPSPKGPWAIGGGGGGKAGPFMNGQTFVRGQNLIARPARQPKALLVRTSNPDPKSQTALEEDLSVMGHILKKATDELPGGQAHPANALGVDLFFSPNAAPMRSLYLDGYGALFFLNVGFPLIAPPEKTEEEKPAADSAWEDAKEELYGQHGPGAMAGEPAEEYSQEKVDKLKETLLDALKNASNIRELKHDESVTLWVSGGAGGVGRFRTGNHKPARNSPGNTIALDQTPSRGSILTIHVKKADIDSYATGKLSRAEFAQRARITTYRGDSTGGGSDPFGYVINGNRY